MAEMKVEDTGDGKDIHYRVHIPPEAFSWFTVDEILKAITRQFTAHLDDALCEMKFGKEAE